MTEYIKRKDALSAVLVVNERQKIKNIPAADVIEVVRCGKCRLGTPSCLPGMVHCTNNKMEHRPDCYCSYGVRKGPEYE